jgi:hypothetical protein
MVSISSMKITLFESEEIGLNAIKCGTIYRELTIPAIFKVTG